MVSIHSSRRILILLTDLHEGHLFKKIMFFVEYMSISSYIRSVAPILKRLTCAETQNFKETYFFNFCVFFGHPNFC